MANEEHVAIMRQGVAVWNKWREENPDVKPDLRGAALQAAGLSEANLSGVDLSEADLSGADLNDASFYLANLRGAHLNNAQLRNADVGGVIASKADLSGADIRWSNISEANFSEANLRAALLTGSNLSETDFTGADLTGCNVYAVAAWNLRMDAKTRQSNLVITRPDEPEVTVDDLEVAQFVYLLLNNKNLRGVIDTLTTKSVLILGRFTAERKAVLDAIRDELRRRDYVPILFDFEKPANRDLTETVMTLASLSRFVIADLSDPNSIPHELMSFAKDLLSVPVKPVFCPTPEHPKPYPMLEHLQRYPHVLPTYIYDTGENLIAALAEQVIAPAEQKANDMRPGGLG